MGVRPAGMLSSTVTAVPFVGPPVLVAVNVNTPLAPRARPVELTVFVNVNFGAAGTVAVALTVVVALAQLVVEQEAPGVAGFVPPEGSTEA